MPVKPTENGSAEAPIQSGSLLPVVGINFGNSYASLAIVTKVRQRRCYPLPFVFFTYAKS